MSRLTNQFRLKKTSTRGHKFKIFKPRCKTNVKKNTLAYRAVNEWNALSNDVIEAENINQFKSKLEEYWHDKEYKINMILLAFMTINHDYYTLICWISV